MNDFKIPTEQEFLAQIEESEWVDESSGRSHSWQIGESHYGSILEKNGFRTFIIHNDGDDETSREYVRTQSYVEFQVALQEINDMRPDEYFATF